MKNLIEQLKKQKRRELTSYVKSQLDGMSLDSSEKSALLDRLAGQYQVAFKESNRYFTIYLFASLFYVFKLAGMRFDVLLVGQKLYDSSYGIFLFSCSGLIFLTISALRAADAAVLEQIVTAACGQMFGKAADLYAKSYVSGGAWMHTLMDIAPSVEGRKSFFALYILQWLTWGVLVCVVAASPIIIGIYVMVDHQRQIIGEHRTLQFYVVFVLTITAIISGMFAVSAQNLDELEP